MTHDRIYLTGIRAYGYVGYIPEEQVLGQWFEVDVTLWIDLSKAGKSDRIHDTHDYRKTIDTVISLVKTSTFALIEALAEAIAQAILSKDERLDQVQVRVSKPAAPIPDYAGRIAVEVLRGRSPNPL
ncbi:MAG: dihydroneopterin aldolase [Synechococcales cyanobacterium T60_A2020_003]|nr:dihydroneopterin aldolase [Synechococcales cyanobacterium T60_A2020_003]